MTNGDGATKDVDFVIAETQQLHIGKSNDGEGLVDLVEVDLVSGKTGVLDGLGNG